MGSVGFICKYLTINPSQGCLSCPITHFLSLSSFFLHYSSSPSLPLCPSSLLSSALSSFFFFLRLNFFFFTSKIAPPQHTPNLERLLQQTLPSINSPCQDHTALPGEEKIHTERHKNTHTQSQLVQKDGTAEAA